MLRALRRWRTVHCAVPRKFRVSRNIGRPAHRRLDKDERKSRPEAAFGVLVGQGLPQKAPKGLICANFLGLRKGKYPQSYPHRWTVIGADTPTGVFRQRCGQQADCARVPPGRHTPASSERCTDDRIRIAQGFS